MSKKPTHWRLMRNWGMIIGSVIIAIAIIFCLVQPYSPLALTLAKINRAPINFSDFFYVPIFCFLWNIFFIITEKFWDNLFATKNAQYEATIPALQIWAKIVFKNSATSSYKPEIVDYVYVYDVLSITFETRDGRRLVFPVTQEQYGLYLENDTGILTYKVIEGKLIFINFERQTQPSQ